jgi:ribonuclease HI
MKMRKVIINTDGASQGNPGPSAIGATIKDEQGNLLASISRYIGFTTNNQAEYRAIIAALQKALGLGATHIELRADTELVVQQLNGRYKVKKASLRLLYIEASRLLGQFQGVTITRIPREQNREADALANAGFK